MGPEIRYSQKCPIMLVAFFGCNPKFYALCMSFDNFKKVLYFAFLLGFVLRESRLIVM